MPPVPEFPDRAAKAGARSRATFDDARMTRTERRASLALTAIYALRMLGLFLVLPVFAAHAMSLPGGDDPRLVGLALGIYGLTQAVLQLPYGAASDRWGRKPVIAVGLAVFALGSFVAALASGVEGVIVGRALQGAGAVSAAVSAFVADSTRESQRTKAMAMIGASIGLSFALSLVLAPTLYATIGMSGIFTLTGLLALAAIAVVAWHVPTVPRAERGAQRARLREVLADRDLLRLNFGIFSVHLAQTAMFVVLPRWLVEHAHLPLPEHWKVYLPVVLGSFAVMMPWLRHAERDGAMRGVFVGAIVALALVMIVLGFEPSGLIPLTALLFAFFAAFNVLEALLPSLVSRLAPSDAKGAALGVYNTTQSLGLFAGGAAGGWLSSNWGGHAVFWMVAVVLLVWAALARTQRRWPHRTPIGEAGAA